MRPVPTLRTGNFIVNILRRINRRDLKRKYREELFANEIMLLPYYIASLNIEHAYYDLAGEYEAFEGICFTDTLELADSQQLSLFAEENTERVQRQKNAEITVIIGNPPYNVGQVSENDNNKNRKYRVVDQRVRETYSKDSKASSRSKLNDAYIKFFRWATDRLQDRDGIICYVSNNSFIDQITFDGMRKHLQRDFSQIYHLDLHGNVRKNTKISGTSHNVFGIQVGVGITIAIRNSQNDEKSIRYHRVPEMWRKNEKLAYMAQIQSVSDIEWQMLLPDVKQTWLTEGMHASFDTYLPTGTKEAKSFQNNEPRAMFKTYGLGAKTARDDWVYEFDQRLLANRVRQFIEVYNSEADRWQRRESRDMSADEFVLYDDHKIKWSRG